MFNNNVDNVHPKLRDDERQQLAMCRRSAFGSGFFFGGLSWIATRYLLNSTGLGKTILGRYPSLVYSVAIGFAFIQGISSTASSCFKKLASLENSRFGEFGKRALQMREDEKKLSKAQFFEKYPRGMQNTLFDTFSKSGSETLAPEQPQSSHIPQEDMFCPAKEPEIPNQPKSFQELQDENRSKGEGSSYHFRDRKPQYDLRKDTTKQIDPINLPPGPEGKLKAKRNKYGDVVYED